MTAGPRTTGRLAAALALALAGAALAKDLPGLPPELKLARSGGSPGQVTFRHSSHVDADAPACLPCHPRLFGMLGAAGGAAPRAVTHDGMERKGEACGACHGKRAFAFEDGCSSCHA